MKVFTVCVLVFIKSTCGKINQEDIFRDYDSTRYSNKQNLRQRFLDKKKQNHEQELKVQLFDRIHSNKTLLLDGILHYLDNNDMKKNNMDIAFRNILTMTGVKYIYKRDFFWRTWREVQNNKGNSSIIFYKCQNIIKNCTKCMSGGYWLIEEKPPPCTYEIFSLKTAKELCVVNYTQYNKTDVCPSVITMRDLKIACETFIETKWQITKRYNVPERDATVICQGRENCEISTLYLILPDSIIFRMINISNHVYYSKVMKIGKKNYICNNDCGVFDPLTKQITKQEGPLLFDLLKNNKKKREDIYSKLRHKLKKKQYDQELLKNGLHYLDPSKEILSKIFHAKKKITKSKNTSVTKSGSHCKKIQEKYLLRYMSEYYDYS